MSPVPVAARGMTLVEIMVVVVILGILATVLVVNLMPKSDLAKQKLAKTQLSTVSQHLQLYQLEQRKLPGAGAGLSVLTKPAARPDQSYYVEPELLLDPWGTPLVYRQPGSGGHPYEILSLGADAQPGGTGVAADVSSIGGGAAAP